MPRCFPKVWVTVVMAVAFLASAACNEKTATPVPGPAAPAAPASIPAARPCDLDSDCVGAWNPGHDGCGPPDRCYGGTCVVPPAMSGKANDQTGRVVFETPAGEKAWQIEVARTPFETQRGLMCRRSMLPDWGMLFLLDATRIQRFWMMNTLIPLDMVFIREDWTVAGIVAEAPPLTFDGRGVGEPSRYVLELGAGEARRAGLATGQRVRFYRPAGE